MFSKRKLKNSTKNLSATLQVEIDPLVSKLEYMNNNRPSKPSLLNVLGPSKLLHTPNCIRRASLVSFGKFSKLPKLQNTLYTLNRYGLCFVTNLLSKYNNGRRKGEATTKEFSLKDE